MEKKYECKACGHDIGFDIIDNKIRCQCCHTVAGEIVTFVQKSKIAEEFIDSLHTKYFPILSRHPIAVEAPWDSRLLW